MERRNYLAGTALGAVTSATALLGGCLDSLETDGTGSGEEDTDTDDTDTSDVDESADDEKNDASDDDTDSTDGEDQDADDSEQDDGEDQEQNGDESRDQDDESEHQGEDENEQADEGDENEQADDGNDESEQTDEGDESAGDGNVEFEVIDMTPSMESGTEFTYIVLAHTDGSESIPGEASLVDETGATVDSTSYEATSGGGSFELTYQAPTVDEETEVALMLETDHGPVNLGSVRVFPSETSENDDSSSPAENSTEDDGSSGPTENSTNSGDSNNSAENNDSSSPTENSTESDD